MAVPFGVVPLFEASSLETRLGSQQCRSAAHGGPIWDRHLRHTAGKKGVFGLSLWQLLPDRSSWVVSWLSPAARSGSRRLVLLGNDQCGVGHRRDDGACGNDTWGRLGLQRIVAGDSTRLGPLVRYIIEGWHK
jgi:hypothetical protein